VLLTALGGELEKFLLEKLYCRHTKASVASAYEVPDYVDRTILLKLAPVERSIYRRIPKGRP
jgi:hypothetical protein